MNAVVGALFAVAAYSLAGCTLPLPTGTHQSPPVDTTPQPVCVPGFAAGQVLTLSLGPVYDANSDYVYDPAASFHMGIGSPSCNAVDGITTGSIVGVAPQKQLSASEAANGSVCSPLAEFDPAMVENNLATLSTDFKSVEGVTIAGAFSDGILAGKRAYVIVGLFTPSMNPSDTLTPRKLPPLVVSRILRAQDWSAVCSDIWVATWTR